MATTGTYPSMAVVVRCRMLSALVRFAPILDTNLPVRQRSEWWRLHLSYYANTRQLSMSANICKISMKSRKLRYLQVFYKQKQPMLCQLSPCADVTTRGGRSHIFRPRIHSCSKIFEFGSRSDIFQIWESDSCSNSGNHRCKRNLALCLLKQWHL